MKLKSIFIALCIWTAVHSVLLVFGLAKEDKRKLSDDFFETSELVNTFWPLETYEKSSPMFNDLKGAKIWERENIIELKRMAEGLSKGGAYEQAARREKMASDFDITPSFAIEIYDITEFLVYAGVPWGVFFMWTFNSGVNLREELFA